LGLLLIIHKIPCGKEIVRFETRCFDFALLNMTTSCKGQFCEKDPHNIRLCMMMIWNLTHLILSYLIAMYMTIRLMIIDTQETVAVRKYAFPAFGRSL
jgi:hypothetical protein